MNKKLIWTMVVVAIIAVAAIWYAVAMNAGGTTSYPVGNGDGADTSTPSAPTSTTPTAPVVGAGEHCGGNILNAPVCAPGYACMPNPESHLPFGDVGGICLPAGGKG